MKYKVSNIINQELLLDDDLGHLIEVWPMPINPKGFPYPAR